MANHIKRDGEFLCKKDRNGKLYEKHPRYVKFSHAHKISIKGFCKDCQKRYYEIVDKMKKPIVVK